MDRPPPSDADRRRLERRHALRRVQVRRRRAAALTALAGLLLLGAWVAQGGSGPATERADASGPRLTTAAGAPSGTTAASGTTTTPRTPPDGPPVSIGWVGDIVLGSSYGMPSDGARGTMAGVRAALRRPDLMVGNLEQTLSVGGASKCGGSTNCFAFQAPPSFAGALAGAGFDVMNLANNHANDFGPSGITQTVAALRRTGLASTGRPGQITVRTVHGVRIALVGFASYPWASRLERIPAAARLVRRAATRGDIVVVAFHGGAEGSDKTHVPRGTEYAFGENRGDLRRFAHAVVDAGADLVVGSGPHVVRGMEAYRGRLIAYSAGNFAGYHNFALGGVLSLTGILEVTLEPDGTWVAGRWTSARLVGPGLPQLDSGRASTTLMRELSREDFGRAAVRFGPAGVLTLPR